MRKKFSLVHFFIVVCIFLLVVKNPCFVYAEGTKEKAVVFLLDVSGSMKSNDPNRYAIDSIAQFIYTLPSNFEIGFVAYNAEVCAEQILLKNAHRNEIMKVAETVQYTGYSNAGAGMMQAVEMLLDTSATEKAIVLLSDGECLMQDEDATKISYTAYQSATVQAKQNGIRIHVVGLGEEMEDIENSIFQAATKTGGGVYHSPHALDIQHSIDAILQEQFRVKQMTAAVIDAGEDAVKMEIDIPFAHASTVRVLLTSSSPIRDLTTNLNAEGVRQVNGERYSLIEIDNPKKDKMELSFSGVSGNQIRMILIPEYWVTPKASVSYQDCVPDVPDALTYEREATITYTFHDMENNNIQLWTEDYFAHSKLSVEKAGNFEEGTLADGQLQTHETVTEHSESEVFFGFAEFPANILGSDTVKIVLEEPPALPIEEPDQFPYTIYVVLFLTIVLVIAAIIVFRLMKNKQPTVIPDDDGRPEPGKSSYVGRLNIYITRTASGYDISPLSYDLFRLPSTRVISMAEILESCGLKETFAGAGRIFISSGQGRSVILTNQSDCCIMKSGEILMKKKSYQLFAGAKVDIMFEDEISELTFQYRELKPSEMY